MEGYKNSKQTSFMTHRVLVHQAKHIDEHEKLECRCADTPCGNRCGLYLPLGDMKRHYTDSCAHRFVPCGLGCGYKVRAKVRELKGRYLQHEASKGNGSPGSCE